jgi:hypothetical protein
MRGEHENVTIRRVTDVDLGGQAIVATVQSPSGVPTTRVLSLEDAQNA